MVSTWLIIRNWSEPGFLFCQELSTSNLKIVARYSLPLQLIVFKLKILFEPGGVDPDGIPHAQVHLP